MAAPSRVPSHEEQPPVDGDGDGDGSASLPSQRAGACGGDGAGIPVVDLGVLVNGAPEARARAIRDLGRACEEWGFFMVTNHGVTEALREAVMESCKELFSLPLEEKKEYMRAKPMDPIRIGTGFYSAVDAVECRRDYLKMFSHPDFHCPPNPAKLREIAMEYSNCTRALLLELTKAISESLGLAGDRLSEALNLGSCFQILVGNHYPVCSRPDEEALGFSSHSDHGLLTLLFQNGVDGLQVKHDGEWVLAKPLPGSFFVIAGDQLEIVTNGRYRGVLHRAMVGGRQSRMSFVSLIGPCLDTVVAPLPEMAADGRGLEFRGIRYRDYMEMQQSKAIDEKTALDVVRVQRQECLPSYEK
ncbi:2-oxoglutarate-dependent dioxygenase 19-like [Oryza brachyantha]|uniref:Fe2OG dioxygenase domain-containing protein n=1 Tax=Oryza brachyantha TaxID=4533 RepID=J3MTV6_ORYBR|nr:2-oxoglutarate-dependent dioxygenase 19-like [Oryza brachyantha]